jgi:polysaccharide biosynthesis/export protein
MRYAIFLSLIFMVVIVCACASAPPPRQQAAVLSPEAQAREIESSTQVKAMNERILMSALSSRKDLYRDYKIGPEDLIEISVFEEEKLNKTVRVSSQGNVSLPLLGVVRVKGLTANDLEKEIRDLLAEKYLQDPHVSVFIKEYRSQRISVMGAVDKPGVFEVSGQKTVLDMLAMAGGLSSGGGKPDAGSLLFLVRPPRLEEEVSKEKKESGQNQDSGEQTPRTFVIDLEELLVKGDLTLNVPLMHGDILNVPASGKIFVGGEVKKPGGFPLMGKRVTVSQAIVMAEGLKTEADGSQGKVFRYSGKGTEKEVITLDLYAIEKGQAEDVLLKENDILFVPTHGVKAFFIGLRDTIKGLIGFGFSTAMF